MGAEGGFVPKTLDEIYAENTMTEAEYRRVMDAHREDMRALCGMGRASAEEQAWRTQRALAQAAGIPEAYLSVPLDHRYDGQLGQGRGLWLCGPMGAGKTWAACAVARAWIAENGRGCLFTGSVAMASSLRSAVSDGRGEEAATRRYASARLLILDDLGKEVPTEWGLSKLFDVIDRRWGARLPTVVTSQDGPDGIAARLAARGDAATAGAIVSRLVGSCLVRTLDGPDRRLAGQR